MNNNTNQSIDNWGEDQLKYDAFETFLLGEQNIWGNISGMFRECSAELVDP